MVDAREILKAARRLPTPAVVLVCTALLAWTQFSTAALLGTDGYFHTRAARELDRHGIQSEFPQTVFSTWSERYSDKDLLFHALMIPFQRVHAGAPDDTGAQPPDEDLVTPGKQAVVFFDLLFFTAFALALRWTGARWAWLWIVLFFVADAPLLYRFVLVRPGILGLTFVVLEIALVMRRKALWLGVVGALHTLSHSSFVLLPIIVLAAAAAHLLRREPFRYRLLGASLIGPAVATVVNPYFPNNLYLAWDQIGQVLLTVWVGGAMIPDFLFGSELFPTTTGLFLGSFPAYLPAVAGIVAFLAFSGRRLSTDGLFLVLVSGLFLCAGFLSERFLAQFFPCAVLLGARLWSELAGRASLPELFRSDARNLVAAVGLVLFCLLFGLGDGSVLRLRASTRSAEPAHAVPPAIEFLKREARPDELVYHNFWWDFSVLYHYRPQGRYVVALDPIFFYRHDPELFSKALEAYQGRHDDVYGLLEREFGARWVYLPKVPSYYPFYELTQRDARFRTAYEDERAVVLELGRSGF